MQNITENPRDFHPELYTDEELDAIEKHIETYFGKSTSVFHELVSPDIHVDIVIIEPDETRPFYTLVTMGMGAHRMHVPEALQSYHIDRAELCICLPANWQIQGKEERDYWPLRWLKILARLPGQEDSWLGWGHTIPNGEPFADNTELCSVLLTYPYPLQQAMLQERLPEKNTAFYCTLPNGEQVCFYQVIPLYEQEMNFKIANGAEALLERFHLENMHIVDLNRENYCAFMGKKEYRLKPSEIEIVLTDWQGATGCLATDRILVDGCKVGYCYREQPMNEYDSGWRFLAGDESEEYMQNPNNAGIYDLNTICNYDREIMSLLNAPYQTAYHRDEKGIFQREFFFSAGE